MEDVDVNLDRVEDAIAAIATGELVVVVDDLDRENEGDLIMAASKVTPEKMALLIRNTSGIICVPMTGKRAEGLSLPPMVADNIDPLRTAFTISVDYKRDLTTGISATERANTARALANSNCGGSDFLRPGHVFPLIAREGGVLVRSGHTEAATDLATLAGLEPVGVLAEIVNDDGTVKRLKELKTFAAGHGLKIISIEDLIAYRMQRESFVSCIGEAPVRIHGLDGRIRVYATRLDPMQHVVAIFGDIHDSESVPVRVHREQAVTDYFRATNRPASWLATAIEHIGKTGSGVVMLLRDASAGEFVETPEAGGKTGERHQSAMTRRERWREVGVGAQILRDLGVRSIVEIATDERNYVGLTGFGIEVTATILVKQ